jgi:predicted Zn-dependent protease
MSNARIQQAREFFERFPTHELARYNYAQALYEDGQYAAAAEHLQMLCAQKPDWMVVHILLGKCRLQTGDRDAAKTLLQRAHDLACAQHHDGPREELAVLLQTW